MHGRIKRVLASAVVLLGCVGFSDAAAAKGPVLAGGTSPLRITPAPRNSVGRVHTDSSLLQLSGSTLTPVVVKLDFDPLATYNGNLAGFAATAPTSTHHRGINPRSGAVRAYRAHVDQLTTRFLARLRRTIPKAVTGSRLTDVYGGVAVAVPADAIRRLSALPGVVAVQRDVQVHTAATVGSVEAVLTGAASAWPSLGGAEHAGAGITIGMLDTGIWPEHPSFTDSGDLPAVPALPGGGTRPCDFGDNPLTPASDPFVCNRKVISGQAFLTTYHNYYRSHLESARDADGHGTLTAAYAAGDVIAHATYLGNDLGAVSGIAPGARLAIYKAGDVEVSFTSDDIAAAGQAVADGVDLISASIGAGSGDPWQDPLQLAYLDAYRAGIPVVTAAGNDGPAASTLTNTSPWVTTVGATTGPREFRSSLHITASGSAGLTTTGATFTKGISPATPVVDAAAVAGYADPSCDDPAPAGSLQGKVVVCRRGHTLGAIKSSNIQAGGAVGLLLVTPGSDLGQPSPVDAYLPDIELDESPSTSVLSFLAAHPNAQATWSAGVAGKAGAERVADFSGRGPAVSGTLKPDIVAPGTDNFGPHTPDSYVPADGPSNSLYQGAQGTSFATPIVAGATALVRAVHPSWTPAQLKSALMTTATTNVLASTGSATASPLDQGSGRLQVDKAIAAGLTLTVSAEDFAAAHNAPGGPVGLNLPNIYDSAMPAELRVYRTVTNVTSSSLTYTAAVSGASTEVSVSPARFTVQPGANQRLTITVNAAAAAANTWLHATLTLTGSTVAAGPALHLPILVRKATGTVRVTTTCTATQLTVPGHAACTATATNSATSAAPGRLSLAASGGLKTASAASEVTLAARVPQTVAIGPLGSDGIAYESLADLGAVRQNWDADGVANFNVPAFTLGGHSYTTIGISEGGFAVPGQVDAAEVDRVYDNPGAVTIPDASAPNPLLAPFITPLYEDGTDATGLYAVELVGSRNGLQRHWTVFEWDVVTNDNVLTRFQLWLGADGVGDVSYTYDPAHPPVAAVGMPAQIGVENDEGSQGVTTTYSGSNLAVTAAAGHAGGSAKITLSVAGREAGTGTVAGSLAGNTLCTTACTVTAPASVAVLATLAVTTTRLPSATRGEPYVVGLHASGGAKPYSWRLKSGSLPKGLTLSRSGVLTGKPTRTGRYPFTVTVVDRAKSTNTASGSLSITVTGLHVTTASLPAAKLHHRYTARLAASGTAKPLRWERTAGTLPAGVKLGRAGIISGTPKQTGHYTFTVRVTDAAHPTNKATRRLRITVRA